MRMPEDPRRVAARDRYVYDLQTLTQLCQDMEIPMSLLREWQRVDKWDEQRAEASMALTPLPSLTDTPDLLSEHERLCGTLLTRLTHTLASMMRPSLDEQSRREIRGQIEMLRSAAEAAKYVVDMHRDVRGIKKGQPSVKDTTTQRGVQYTVILPPTPSESGSKI